MKKKLISAAICLCLILVMFPASVLAAYKNPFTDVKETDWYYKNVQYVYENGLMNGITSTTFEPTGITNRGMVVTILYRQEGEPTVTAKNPFGDVGAGTYYEKAIIWANQNKIVNGYSATQYAPEDPITREQMAAIIYRYADYKEYDVTAKTALSKYQDINQLSSWAEAAMSWANAEGLINGMTETTLAPQGNAERAQVAAILQRFVENIVPEEGKPEAKPTPTPVPKPTSTPKPTPTPEPAFQVETVEELASAIKNGEKKIEAQSLVVGNGEVAEIPEDVDVKVTGTLTVEAGGEFHNNGGSLDIDELVLNIKEGDAGHSVFVNSGKTVIKDVILEDNSWEESFDWIEFSNGIDGEDNSEVSMTITGKLDIGACNPVANMEDAVLTVAKGAVITIDGGDAGIDNWGTLIVDGSVMIEDGTCHGPMVDEEGHIYSMRSAGWYGSWGDTVVNGEFVLGKGAWIDQAGSFTVGKNGTLTLEEGIQTACGYYAVDEDGNILTDEDGNVIFEATEWDEDRSYENWHEEWLNAGIMNSGTFTIDGKAVVGANSEIVNGSWGEDNNGVVMSVNGTADLFGNLHNTPYDAQLNVSGDLNVSSGYLGNDGALLVEKSGKITIENANFDNSDIGTVVVDGIIELADARYLGICEYADEWGNVWGEYENVAYVNNGNQFVVNGEIIVGVSSGFNNWENGILTINGVMTAEKGERQEYGYYTVAEDGQVTLTPGEWDDERGGENWYDEWSCGFLGNEGQVVINGTLNAASIDNRAFSYEGEEGLVPVSGKITVADGGNCIVRAWFNNNSDWYEDAGEIKWVAAEVIVDEGGTLLFKNSEDSAASLHNRGYVEVNGAFSVEKNCDVNNNTNEYWDNIDGEDQCVSAYAGKLIINGTMDMTDVYITWFEYENEPGQIFREVNGIECSRLENNGEMTVNGRMEVYASAVYSNNTFTVAEDGEVEFSGVVVDVDSDGTPEYYAQNDLHFNGDTNIRGSVVMNDCGVCNWGEGTFSVDGDVEINGGTLCIGENAGVEVGNNASLNNNGVIIIYDREKEDGTIERHIPLDLSAFGNVEVRALISTYEGLMAANAADSGFTSCELEGNITVTEDTALRISLMITDVGYLTVEDGCTVTISGSLYNYNRESHLQLNGSAKIELVGNATGDEADHGYNGNRDGFDISEDEEQPEGSEYAYKITIKNAE